MKYQAYWIHKLQQSQSQIYTIGFDFKCACRYEINGDRMKYDFLSTIKTCVQAIIWIE